MDKRDCNLLIINRKLPSMFFEQHSIKGGNMISSPCKSCSKINLPKEKCVKECKLLQAIQDMELTSEKLNDGSSIDYSEEYSYNVPLRLSMGSF